MAYLRNTMTILIEQVRRLIGDPPGSCQEFTNEEIQDALDRYVEEARYSPLNAQQTIYQGGSIIYLNFYAPVGNWETDAVLVDGNYGTVSPATSNYVRGKWTFAGTGSPLQGPQRPVMLIGQTYDIYAAAAELVLAWMGVVKQDYDFKTAAGDQYMRSQQLAGIRRLYFELLSSAKTQSGCMERRDIAQEILPPPPVPPHRRYS